MRIPQVFTLILTNHIRNIIQQKTLASDLLTRVCLSSTQTRGRTGMDVTPLVFETSASTDSAIWAFFLNAMQRYCFILKYANFRTVFSKKSIHH